MVFPYNRFERLLGFVRLHPFLSTGIFHAVLITLFSIFTFFWGHGHIVFIDLTEGINLSDAYNRIFYSYANNLGEAIAEKQRVVPFTNMWVFYKILNLSEENFVPFRILFGYYLSIVGFVFLLSSLNLRSIKNKGHFLFGAAFIATAFYLYNPWMTNRILHNFLYFSTFTVTVHIALLYKCLFDKSLTSKKTFYILMVLNGLLLGTFMGTPHTALLILISSLPLIVIALIQKTFLRTLIYSLVVPLIGVVSGLYWLLPFVLYKPIPDRVESTTILDLLSQKASVFNVLKLQGYWWDRILPGYFPDFLKEIPGGENLFDILYLIPLLFLASAIFYFRKSKIAYYISIIFIVGLFLSSYTSYSKNVYEFLMFQNYYTSIVGWLFREIEKFSYLIALVYSLSIFLVLNIKSKKSLRAFYVFAIILTVLNIYYLIGYTQKNLRKVVVPNDYSEVNNLLLKDSSQYNIAYYPQVQFLKWAPNIDSANYVSNLSSDKPALPNVEGDSYTKYFINTLLEPQMLNQIDVGEALNIMGIKYLIIRNDSRGKDLEETLYDLNKQASLSKIWEGHYLTVYENHAFNGLLEIKNEKLVTNMGLNFLETFNISGEKLSDYLIEYSDFPLFNESFNENDHTSYLLDDEGFMDLAMSKFSSDFVYPSDYIQGTNPNAGWAIVSLSNKTHAENDLYFNNFDITNRQSNYGKEVILSLGGLSFNKNSTEQPRVIYDAFIFPQADSFQVTKESEDRIEVKFLGEEKDYIWNIFRSGKVDITKINAIGFEGKFEGGEYLEPHIKFYYYDSSFNYLGNQVFYPQGNEFSGVFKAPRGANYIDFSLWVRGKNAGKVDYTFKNLKFYDVGTNYSFPEINFELENRNCENNCVLYARILESTNYPSNLEIVVNENNRASINNTRINSKYKWIRIMDLDAEDKYNIIIRNLEGFNSVASIAIVDENRVISELNNYKDYLESDRFSKEFFDGGKVLYKAGQNRSLETQRRLEKYVVSSPVQYGFQIASSDVNDFLVFKKPYKPGWELRCDGKTFNSMNVFSIGWKIDLNSNQCEILYTPQSLFELGVYISFVAGFMAFISVVVVKTLDSR